MSSIPVLPAFPPLMFQQNEPQKTQYVSKPFKCMTCLRSFRRMEHLNRHILTHTGERPFKCEVEGCGRCFSRQDTLLRHLKVHNKSNDKKKKKQAKKTTKKKVKNTVKRKSTSDAKVTEEKNKKQKFDSIIISAEPEITHPNTSVSSTSYSLALLNSNDKDKKNSNDSSHPLNRNGSPTENIKKDYTNTSSYINHNHSTIADSTNPYDSSFDDFFEKTNPEDQYSSTSTSLKPTTYSENKSIPVSNIDEAVKLFDLSSQSPTTLYSGFKKSSQSPTSMYQKFKEPSSSSTSFYPRGFDDFKEDKLSSPNANLNSDSRSAQGKSFDPPTYMRSCSQSSNRYHDSNNINPSSSFTDFDGLNQFSNFNGYDDFPNMNNFTEANYKDPDKLSSPSAANLSACSLFNDPLMMDIQVSSSAAAAAATQTISSPISNQYDKQLTDSTNPLLISTSLSTSVNTSSALYVNPTLTSNYASSSPPAPFSLSVPLDVNLRDSSTNNRFYSSITLPSDTAKEENSILQNKKSLLDKPTHGQRPIPSSSSLSITIPSSFDIDTKEEKRLKEEKDKPLARSVSLTLGKYSSNYTSLIPSTSPTSTTFLTMSEIEEKEKEGEKAQKLYRTMTFDMNLPSTSNHYSDFVASNLSTDLKSIPPPTSSVTSTPSSTTYLLSEGVVNGAGDLSMKNVFSSAKNDEIVDPSSSVSSNYLTPPLSPSLPTSTFVECQEQVFPPPKIYPCGLDTPCIDNCNCSECITIMPLPNLLNRQNTEMINEENSDNANNDIATTSQVSPSRSANSAKSIKSDVEVSKKEEKEVEHSWDYHEHSCQICHDDSHQSYDHSYDHDHCENNHSHHYEHDHSRNHNHDHDQNNNYIHNDHDHRHYDHKNYHDQNENSEFPQDHQNYEVENSKVSTTTTATSATTKATTNIDKNMSYGTGDVIIEVGCSNTNCPRTDCPRRTFKPIASVSNGKICRTSDAMEFLNDAPLCNNYNPLYHLIAAAEIATKKINNDNNNNNDNDNNKNNNNNSNKISCAHCSKAKACQVKDSSSLSKNSKNTNPSSPFTTNVNSCQHCSTDIENCHMALTSASSSTLNSPSVPEDPYHNIQNRPIPFKNYRSIKASAAAVKNSHHHHHLSFSTTNATTSNVTSSYTKSKLNQVSTVSESSENYSNSFSSNLAKSDHVTFDKSVAPTTTTTTTTTITTMTMTSPKLSMSPVEKSSDVKEEDFIEKNNGGNRSSHHFKSIYIRQDYSPHSETTTSALTTEATTIKAIPNATIDETTSIYYESINYTKLLANQMKIDAENPDAREKTIQNYEMLKKGLASSSSTTNTTTSTSSSTTIFRNPSSALNSTLNSTNILRPKLSWIPAPIHSQLEPTINPILLKTNLYANVNLNAATTESKTNILSNRDPVIDTCQVTTTNLLDKKQAIEQAIRCSHCPHSDRCYKRIRIEQLIN